VKICFVENRQRDELMCIFFSPTLIETFINFIVFLTQIWQFCKVARENVEALQTQQLHLSSDEQFVKFAYSPSDKYYHRSNITKTVTLALDEVNWSLAIYKRYRL